MVREKHRKKIPKSQVEQCYHTNSLGEGYQSAFLCIELGIEHQKQKKVQAMHYLYLTMSVTNPVSQRLPYYLLNNLLFLTAQNGLTG